MANQQELEILLKAKNLTEEAFRAVERATSELEKKTKGNKSGFDEFRSSVNSFFKDNEESFTSLGKGLGLAATGVGVVGAAVVALGVRGSTVQAVKSSFDSLASSVGDTGDEILKVTRTATKGLISDMDIMAAVNKGILLGLPLTSKEMGTLAETAIVLGKAMQRGPTDALNDLIVGLGRGSPLILDNLGITLDSAKAYEQYGASIGKSAKDLSDAEKKIALYREATSAAAAKVAELGGIQLTFADRITQGKVALSNMLDGMGVAVATSPAVNRAFEVISGSVIAAFGGNSQTAVKTLGDWVNKFASWLVTAAQVAVTGASWIVQAWDGLKVLFAGVMVAIVGLAEGVVTAFGMIVNAATKIPKIGDQFKGTSAAIEDQRVVLNAMRKDFQSQVGETLDGAAQHKAAFDGMSKGLTFLQAEMQKAVASGKEYKAGSEEQARASSANAAASTEASKAVKEWKEKAAELDKQLKLAKDNQVPLTTVTEQYGSAIAEVVRQADIMGLKVPESIKAAAAAINAAKLVEVMQDIRNETAKTAKEMQENFVKGQRAVADALSESLISAVSAEREYQQKRTEAMRAGVVGRLAAIEDERREALLKLGEPPKGMEEQWRKSTAAINAYYGEMTRRAADQSQAMSGAFAGAARSLAGEIEGVFKSVLEGAAALVEGLVAAARNKFDGLAGFMNSKLGKTAIAGLQIGAEGFTYGYGAGQALGRGRGALAGGINGAMGGMALGAQIGAAGGPIGALGGLLIGGAAGILGGLFGGGKKAAEEKAAVAEMRAELVKVYGTLENVRSVAESVGVSMDVAFSSKKPEDVRRNIEQLNAALDAKKARLEGIAQSYDALGARTDIYGKQAFAAIDKLREANEAELASAQRRGATEAEISELRKFQEAALTQTIADGAARQEGGYQRLGQFATAIIAQQIKETGDLIGAFDAAESTLGTLAKAQQTFGFEADGAFGKAMQMRDAIAVNRDIYDGISADAQMMRAFGQANIMTHDLFMTFGADVGEQLSTLEGRHADMNVAMAAAQPILQQLWEGQKRFGNVTDETTAKYLNLAEEQGIVGPQMQSVNQQILDVLLEIKSVLSSGITGGFREAEGAAHGVVGAIERITDATNNIPRSVQQEFRQTVYTENNITENVERHVTDIYEGERRRGEGGGEQGFDSGTMGVFGRWWHNFGTGTRTRQDGETAIIHPHQVPAFVSEHLDYDRLASAIAGAGGGSQAPIVVQIGNRAIRDYILKTANGAAGRLRVDRRAVRELA